ncbi:MAG: nucleotidyltransferase family protein [Bacteroidales bacterium]|nr:nucleotidyltransferase family protein [Bacteroidales bacterium]
MYDSQAQFLALIKLSLNLPCEIPQELRDNEIIWEDIFNESQKQSVLGIAFIGLSYLKENDKSLRINNALFVRWFGFTELLKQRNKKLDSQTAYVYKVLTDHNLNATILKGQGIASLYEDRLSNVRQPGDIDVWVKGGFSRVKKFVEAFSPSNDFTYHRFHVHFFDDTEVELHHRPTLMRNLIKNIVLQRWCDSFNSESFIYLPEKGFSIPSIEFNRIFILTHIFRHFLFEGIGLRQIIDYYFVLKAEKVENHKQIEVLCDKLGFLRFAKAVMWVLHEKLGLDEEYLWCAPDEKEGRVLLKEILNSGNFGQYDIHNNGKNDKLSKFFQVMKHECHLVCHYPSEVLWTPIWYLFHWGWKKRKIL